ncbi:hypothetical protein L1987_36146 [Smallanthus sonchifolius]|uniref:Uncharacterized protein n=1 Tax=Smallanthus sonchifolius TaxID=185202 RepID=A0ACB9HF45_9ASTR|nr:hypothetical protein L1987_36146 [Smallanthus sonchifolius]
MDIKIQMRVLAWIAPLLSRSNLLISRDIKWANHFKAGQVKLGIGGFSMGAACALYSATCFVQGRYGNGIPYPVNFKAIVRLSGWLHGGLNLRNMIEGSHDAIRRAALLPVLLRHGVDM